MYPDRKMLVPKESPQDCLKDERLEHADDHIRGVALALQHLLDVLEVNFLDLFDIVWLVLRQNGIERFAAGQSLTKLGGLVWKSFVGKLGNCPA